MALSQKQKAIIDYLGDDTKTKAQITNRFRSLHYTNSSKHIGGILTRMVKRGLVVRVKIGTYKRGDVIQTKSSAAVSPNQLLLF